MADDVWSYATGERGAERARHGLEQAGAEFERAAAPVVARLNGIETHREQARSAAPESAGAGTIAATADVQRSVTLNLCAGKA